MSWFQKLVFFFFYFPEAAATAASPADAAQGGGGVGRWRGEWRQRQQRHADTRRV